MDDRVTVAAKCAAGNFRLGGGCGECSHSFILVGGMDYAGPQSCTPRLPWGSSGVLHMTLSRFVTKNAFRNKRRSILTVLSIAFSLLLLTLMMTIWRAFYLDQGSAESAERLWCGIAFLSHSICPAITGRKF